jgi:LytS/YehU family sensor histidine kinase
VPQSWLDSQIPPFTLQLLIENAIKHNIVSLDKPLRIRIFTENDQLVIENNLQLKRFPEASTGLGLDNISQRYLHLANQSIQIIPTEQNFTVKLPRI